jgi:predicted ATPase/DNA-binding winged helix-turn-helix (wHTH) protein
MTATDRAITFGPFRLLPARRLLLEGDKPLRLGSRAMDILIALAERPGELVGKDELRARVWPDTVVEDANLSVQIAALRRALGDGSGGNRYLATVVGRGYTFVARVGGEAVEAPPRPHRPAAAHNLPVLLTRLVGRETVIRNLARQLPRLQLLTIVGPGGIGKTSVALALAEMLIGDHEHGVWLVDLAPLQDARLVPSAFAEALDLPIRADDPLPGLVAALRHRRLLVVLDNCEHVPEAAAALAVGLLRAVPGLQILATSREPLRVEGEQVYRLPPLETPPPNAAARAADARATPAIQLFIERAAAVQEELAFDDADISVVADICRKLDGIPLAIELAAARIDALGVRGIASRLDDGLRYLSHGRRAAPARHQTMRATLDWSHALLSEAEQRVFRRVAVFAGGFTLQAAGFVAGDPGVGDADTSERLLELAAKSLLVAEVGDAGPRCRLAETTRAYAGEKLAASGEAGGVRRRHAEYFRDLLQAAAAAANDVLPDTWYATHGPELDDVRAALDWAFSPEGERDLAVALTVAAIPLWIGLSLFPECRRRAEQALAAVAPDAGSRGEMRLYAALAASRFHTIGPVQDTFDAWSRTLSLAASLGATEYRLRALWGLWSYRINSGAFATALTLAEDFGRLAGGGPSPADVRIADRMLGTTQHYLGDQPNARRHLERARDRSVGPSRRSDIVRFQLDPRITMLSVLARVLWLQGFAEQALGMVERNVEAARTLGHAVTLFNALLAAGQVALLAGDLPAAERYVAMLTGDSSGHAMSIWEAWGQGLRGVLLIQRGDAAGGLPILRATLDELGVARSGPRYAVFFGPLALGLARSGRIEEGLRAVEEAIAQCEHSAERWNIAELLRIKGTLLRMDGATGAATSAEACFVRSLELARGQGALAWELRTAISLAELWQAQGRPREARDLLGAIYQRCSEGFETDDPKRARQLIDELS